MINESEICTSYRQAKDKTAQISILADLHATTPVNIRDILEQNGFIVESMEATPPHTPMRKRWTTELIEEVAMLWAAGTTADELAQQYQTTIAAIMGLQHRNKKVFERYMAQSLPKPQPDDPIEVPGEVALEEKAQELEPIPLQYKPLPTVAGARLNSVRLLLTHARTLHLAAHEALCDGRDVDCAYALGELSQVLIRAKETTTLS